MLHHLRGARAEEVVANTTASDGCAALARSLLLLMRCCNAMLTLLKWDIPLRCFADCQFGTFTCQRHVPTNSMSCSISPYVAIGDIITNKPHLIWPQGFIKVGSIIVALQVKFSLKSPAWRISHANCGYGLH